MQSGFYVLLGLFVCAAAAFGGRPLSLALLFEPAALDDSRGGLAVACAFVATAVCSAVWLAALVGRARKCPDFAFTVYFVHCTCSCAYSRHLPGWVWCATIAVSFIVTEVLGECLCMRHELRDIKLHSSPLRAPPPLV